MSGEVCETDLRSQPGSLGPSRVREEGGEQPEGRAPHSGRCSLTRPGRGQPWHLCRDLTMNGEESAGVRLASAGFCSLLLRAYSPGCCGVANPGITVSERAALWEM